MFAQEPAARPLLSLGEETIGEEFHRLYLENRLEVWKWILETHLKVNHYKARALLFAQTALSLAVLSASCLLALLLVSFLRHGVLY